MPLQRKMTHIPALDSMCQLLAELQLGGHLNGVELPDWATGTSVEEVFNAVRHIGDAEWLDGVYDGYGPQQSADRWLEEFMNGKEVPDIDDAKRLSAGDAREFDIDAYLANVEDCDEEEAQARKGIAEFLSSIPESDSHRFKQRLEQTAGFYTAAVHNINVLGMAMAASLAVDDEKFSSLNAQFTFLEPAAAGDPQLAQMSKHYLIDNYDSFLDAFEPEKATRAKAVKRIKALGAKLKKAIKATSAAKA